MFDDSDLADIEGSEEDEEDSDLEEEFESLESEENEGNFEEEDFEVVDEEEDSEEESEEESEDEDVEDDDFDKEDYEIISDKKGYEVISDEELEQEFEEETAEEESSEAEEFFEEDEDIEGGEDIEELEDLPEEEAEDPSVLEEEEAVEEPVEEIEPLEESEEMKSDETSEDNLEKDLEDFSSISEASEEQEEALNLIQNIRYLVDKDQIVIDCSEATSYQERRNEETNQFIIEILQAKLADNLHWPYVLRDFKTKFGLIKADQKDPSTVRIIIQLKEGAGFPTSVLTESSDQIVVAYGQALDHQIVPDESVEGKKDYGPILPAKTLEDLYFGNVQFTGSPISFHVIDAPIKQVLRFISEESGLNMVIGESVKGTITLKLEDVPWDQALYTIFKVKSLGYTRDGNVITILPLTEIEARTKKLKQIAERQKSLSPYQTKAISISYGKISEIAAKVKDFSTPKTSYSKGGRIIVHPESNTFVVIDTAEVIEKIEALVRYLDKAPKQVMVEAKIVEVSENFAQSFGLSWGLSGNIPVTINASGIMELLGGISGNYRSRFEKGNQSELNLSGIPIIGDIRASLDLAESDGYAKVISSPKVVVISGKQANITRNTPIQIPASTNTTQNNNGSTSVQQSFETENVAITLDVTPTVTTTGSVFLSVSVDRSDPGGREGAFKTQRSAKTEVLVKNGQTIVIGGIYEQDEVVNNEGLPWLKKIPFLNMLFNTTGKNKSNSELLVFITPKLLDSHE